MFMIYLLQHLPVRDRLYNIIIINMSFSQCDLHFKIRNGKTQTSSRSSQVYNTRNTRKMCFKTWISNL